MKNANEQGPPSDPLNLRGVGGEADPRNRHHEYTPPDGSDVGGMRSTR